MRKSYYLELMEKTLSAYSTEHIKTYFNQVKTEGLKEVKVCNGNDYYCISQMVGTRGDVNDDRWAIAILKLDAENLLTYKYMHPTTQEIVMNPSELDIATLPKL